MWAIALIPKSHPPEASGTLTFKRLMGLERFSKTFATFRSKRSLFEENFLVYCFLVNVSVYLLSTQ
ncbi:MAG: hypothetical protein KME55_09770 [Nostoc indistinguendum CM1-VF10]|nr:hypothetical protein [Nostoc indistinguendum CM1-VF10]